MVRGAPAGARRIGRLETQFEAHHEIDPSFLVRSNGSDDRSHLCLGQSIVAKNFRDLLGFNFWEFNRLAVFAIELGGVVLCSRSSPPNIRRAPWRLSRRLFRRSQR